MTQDDIIRLTKEAGFADGMAEIMGLEGFYNFAALVAAAEREACAKVAENGLIGHTIAIAIRARGEQEQTR